MADTVRLVAGIAAWIAHIAFWVLLVEWDDLRGAGATVFLLLCHGVRGTSVCSSVGPLLFAPHVAILAVGLVFAVFKGDSRVS